ncbi:tyrosine--tRNA ligase [Parvularcula sp. IMCC14364]|uniref:tyrosine--tRNA ligase n=1 Tax=Parvularcula sp. IMCC14364 TaxID=3067902 RepID=UPI003557F570
MEALDKRAASETLTAYIGFDATATSLHAGSLIQIMMLYWFQQTGHRPIALMGGGTTKVGDPTGKDAQRKLLTDDDINNNLAGIRKSFAPFLSFGDGPTDAIMVNNDDWLSQLKYVDFLRDYGIHFTINRMLTFDSVKLRLERESPMTFLEFNYILMQAYDYLELNQRYGCVLQMGGSDQWGNIVNGVELCRRVMALKKKDAYDKAKLSQNLTGTDFPVAETEEMINLDESEVFGLTTPLLTTASGKKMGKTEGGAVWLNADQLSPYDYWQYWRNTEDADVGRMLRLFTVLPLDEVARLESLDGAEINDAKKILATEVTALLHGRAAAEEASETARRTFEEGASTGNLPTYEISSDALAAGLAIYTPFRETGLIGSNGEGRRHIKAGALKVNGTALTEERELTGADAVDGVIKLSIGKKKHALVRLV